MTVRYLLRAANIVRNEYDIRYYNILLSNIRDAFNERFFNCDIAQYSTGSQCSYAMPLFLHLVQSMGDQGIYEEDPRLTLKVVRNLIKVVESHDNRLTTGYVGIPFVIQTLARYGLNELIYKMLNHEKSSGYGFQMGQIDEWFFNSLAGIRTYTSVPLFIDEVDTVKEGYQRFRIAPKPIKDLTYLKSSYETLYGVISVDWIHEMNVLKLNISVPVNTTAVVSLPGESKPREVESGKHQFTVNLSTSSK